MIEDDTLAAEDWYPRTLEALEEIDDQHRSNKQLTDWLCLRLFFTEEFLGWNIEEWPAFLIKSISMVAIVGFLLTVLRQWIPPWYIPTTVILAIATIYVPSLIILYLAAGRLSMQPLTPGIIEMPKFGCCAQGLVFPRQIVPDVIERLEAANGGYVDQTLEQMADEDGSARWAIMPSLLQHVGGHSSKGDDFGQNAEWGRSVAQKIWNFGFESYGGGKARLQGAG